MSVSSLSRVMSTFSRAASAFTSSAEVSTVTMPLYSSSMSMRPPS
jgi:hypothetical protein